MTFFSVTVLFPSFYLFRAERLYTARLPRVAQAGGNQVYCPPNQRQVALYSVIFGLTGGPE
jgi:hypothetical protein